MGKQTYGVAPASVARYTIDLPMTVVAGLQALVARYNADAGADLTVAAWIREHLSELVIGPQLAASIETLKQQAEANAQASFEAAVRAERTRLLTALDAPPPAEKGA